MIIKYFDMEIHVFLLFAFFCEGHFENKVSRLSSQFGMHTYIKTGIALVGKLKAVLFISHWLITYIVYMEQSLGKQFATTQELKSSRTYGTRDAGYQS